MKQRHKDFIAGAGWMLNMFLLAGLLGLFWLCAQPEDKGYTKAQLARMDSLIANLEPLSIADLGIDTK